MEPSGDSRFLSLARVPFWVTIFDPHPGCEFGPGGLLGDAEPPAPQRHHAGLGQLLRLGVLQGEKLNRPRP